MSIDVLLQIESLLRELINILSAEHEKNWVAGLRGLISDVESVKRGNISIDEGLREIAYNYRLMAIGSGSFSDWHVWRDDFSQRISANQRLDEVRRNLWNALIG